MTLILPRELPPFTRRVNHADSHPTLTQQRESHKPLTSTNTSNSHRTLGLSREDRDSTLGLSPPLVRARVPRVTTSRSLMFDTPNEPHKPTPPPRRRRRLPCGGPAGALIAVAVLAALVAWKMS